MSGGFGFTQSKQKSSTQDQLPKEFQQLRPDLKRLLQGLSSGGRSDPLGGIPQSEASQTGYTAPIAPGEQAMLDALAAEGGARQGLLDQTLRGDFVAAGNPFTQAAIEAAQRPTIEAYEQTVGRVLPGQFSRAGHRVQPGQSSPFDTAAAIESRGFANALADQAVREAEAMGFDLATAEGRSQYSFFKRSQSHGPGGGVTVNLGAEAKSNPWTERGMKRVDELDAELAQAQTMLPEFREAKKAINSGAFTGLDAPAVGVNTPWGVVGVDIQPEIVSGLRVLSALGLVDEGRMAQTERLQQVQNRLAPLVRPPGSGSTSDFEAQMYLQAVPGLMQTKEGNLLLIDAYERLVSRKRQEMAILEGMIEEGSYSPARYFDRVNQLGKVFDGTTRTALEKASEPQVAAAPTTATSPSVTGAVPQAPAAPVAPTGAPAIDQMSREDIMLLDISTLTPAQRQQVANRMSQIGM